MASAATRALRADPRFATMPIIAMTANAMKADLDACLAAGMNDYVTKPIDRKALVATLRRWLPAAQSQPPAAAHAARADAGSAGAPPARRRAVECGAAARRHRRERHDCSVSGIERATPRTDAVAVRRRAAADAGCPARRRRRGRWRRGRPARARDCRRRRKSRRRCAARRREGARAGGTRGPDGSRRRSSLSSKSARPSSSASIETLRPPAAARPTSPDAALRSRRWPAPRSSASRSALDDYDLSSASGALADLGHVRPAGLGGRRISARLRRCVDGYEYDEARGDCLASLARVRGDA